MTIPKKWRTRSLIATGLLGAVVSTVLVASSGEAAEQGGRGHSSPEWVGTWATATSRGLASGSTFEGLNNQSVRMIVHGSVGGAKVRVRLTNVYGDRAVEVGRATVAKPNTTTPVLSDIDAASTRELRFNGSPTATINRGAELLSDPVDLRLADDQDLVVSVYFPTPTGLTTFHNTSLQSNFVGTGDVAAAPGGEGYTTERTCCWFFLSSVDVLRGDSNGTVGVFGDSLADGNGTTFNGNMRWPNQLTDRLLKVRGDVPGVLNFGLAGSRLNHEGNEPGDGGFPGSFGLGTNALARMDEDVFSETGLHSVVVDLGINDIWMNAEPADKIIASLRQINQQARERDIQVIIGTLGPFNGFATAAGPVWTAEKEASRNAVNTYLREHRHEFDAVVDFDKLLRDPADPSKLKPEFDSGDHIHPNDAGAKAMADAIPLGLIVR